MNKRYKLFSGLILALLLIGCTSSHDQQESNNLLENGRWIDLTHSYTEDAIFWPTAQEFNLDTVSHGLTDAGYFYPELFIKVCILNT